MPAIELEQLSAKLRRIWPSAELVALSNRSPRPARGIYPPTNGPTFDMAFDADESLDVTAKEAQRAQDLVEKSASALGLDLVEIDGPTFVFSLFQSKVVTDEYGWFLDGLEHPAFPQ